MSGFPWTAFGWGSTVSAGAAFAVLLGAFAAGLHRGTHRVADVAWGLGFAAVALASYGVSEGTGDPGRRLLATSLTVVWGVRLSGHIAWRARGLGEDPRYDRMLSQAPGSRTAYALRKVYLLQGALVWLVSLPVQAAQYEPGPPGAAAAAGAALWAVGLFFEAVGDCQLARFKADQRNRGRIMDRGLWRYTRHPNYFGDCLVWWGLFLAACDHWAGLPTLVSPLLMTVLLTAGSGKRLLERQLSRRPGYAEYATRTSGFIPLPPRG